MGPPFCVRTLLSLLQTMPSAVVITIAVFIAIPFTCNCHRNASKCLPSSLPNNKGRIHFFFGNAVTSRLSPGSHFLFSASGYFAFQPCTKLILGESFCCWLAGFPDSSLEKCRITEAIPLSTALFPISALSASLNDCYTLQVFEDCASSSSVVGVVLLPLVVNRYSHTAELAAAIAE